MPRSEGTGGRRRPGAAVKALVMLVLWRLGALRRRRRSRREERREPAVDPSERKTGAPRWVEPLLLVLDPQTQLLGASLGLALALLAATLVVAGKRLVPQETKVEERPRLEDPEAVSDVAERARAGVDGITRRRLLAGAAGVAGAGLT